MSFIWNVYKHLIWLALSVLKTRGIKFDLFQNKKKIFAVHPSVKKKYKHFHFIS